MERLRDESRLRQTYSTAGGKIYTVTTVPFRGVDPNRVREALLEAPWSWWEHGRISGWQRLANGGARFVLFPAWLRLPSQVGIELTPPQEVEEPLDTGEMVRKTVLAARFFANFDGPGRYEILKDSDGAVLRSVWDGVSRRGLPRLLPLRLILRMHLDAEAGTLRFPLPQGTGFPGLVSHLERR